ncbi:hypothetical protein HanRHA438_Chr04g0175961 [Helianthus annuus]|uniref:Uncharacterized protein n=1 Tax=Helianthus annuus TaxID=4232 RepID=A0A9K3J840_HELAN|nr:hypothetical protein HanXRQr2_Chr04g0166341 [Helianthus annuus]KAJ0926842.1 hypothetical protein HanRHA438_Chr04g0175961 [Helianthus annuus]KAJ0931298.1 hypothetical protein HanPSC8_Chr04g0159991 [Helianthus annuus]
MITCKHPHSKPCNSFCFSLSSEESFCSSSVLWSSIMIIGANCNTIGTVSSVEHLTTSFNVS